MAPLHPSLVEDHLRAVADPLSLTGGQLRPQFCAGFRDAIGRAFSSRWLPISHCSFVGDGHRLSPLEMAVAVDSGTISLDMPTSMLEAPWAIKRSSIIVSALQFILPAAANVAGRISVSDFGSPDALSFCATEEYEHLLIPDVDYIQSLGYAELKRDLLQAAIAFDQKRSLCFWRGALTTHGPVFDVPTDASPAELAEFSQRVRLCLISRANPQDVDARCTNLEFFPYQHLHGNLREIVGSPVAPAVFGQYKMVMDVDGFSNSWRGLFLKFLTGSVVLKVASPLGYKQWYYSEISPWVHYIPVAADCSDLQQQIQWVRDNDRRANEIAANGLRFATDLVFAEQMEFLRARLMSSHIGTEQPEPMRRRVETAGRGVTAARPEPASEVRSGPPPLAPAPPVSGFVDTLYPANVLRGWATQTGNPAPIRIEVTGPAGLIGTGTTGEPRLAPPGDCGFTIALPHPIAVTDLFDRRVTACAIGADGGRHELSVWDKIRQNGVAPVVTNVERSEPLRREAGPAGVGPPIRDALFRESPYAGFDPRPYPDDLQGWGSDDPMLVQAIQLLRPGTVCEIGSWKGRSAVNMARAAKAAGLTTEIVCVDTWLGSPEHWMRLEAPDWYESLHLRHGYPNLYYIFLANVVRAGLADIITPFPMTSENAAVIFERLSVRFDLVYLDAAHEYGAVKRDLAAYYDLLNDDGLVIGDDYMFWHQVTRAADDFARERGLKILGRPGKFVLAKGRVDPRLVLGDDATDPSA